MHRRIFIKRTLAAGIAAVPAARLLASTEMLPKTPPDFEGPFYPVGPRNRVSDLILGEPRDEVLEFSGVVVNVHGDPLPGALVGIWQTDRLGRYQHPRDTSPGERWDDFLYWGESVTRNNGAFEFRTYVPAGYGRRPPHIHYKVWRERQHLLTSQVYFREFGGARGASRFPDRSALQTVALEHTNGGVAAMFRIVV